MASRWRAARSRISGSSVSSTTPPPGPMTFSKGSWPMSSGSACWSNRGGVTEAEVQVPRLGLAGAGRQVDPTVAAAGGLVLEGLHDPAGQSLPTVGGGRPDPLDLGGVVVVVHEGAAGDALAVPTDQQERAIGLLEDERWEEVDLLRVVVGFLEDPVVLLAGRILVREFIDEGTRLRRIDPGDDDRVGSSVLGHGGEGSPAGDGGTGHMRGRNHREPKCSVGHRGGVDRSVQNCLFTV